MGTWQPPTMFQRIGRKGNTRSILIFHNGVKNENLRMKVSIQWRFQEVRDDVSVDRLLRNVFFFWARKTSPKSGVINGWCFQIKWVPHHKNIVQIMNMKIKNLMDSLLNYHLVLICSFLISLLYLLLGFICSTPLQLELT